MIIRSSWKAEVYWWWLIKWTTWVKLVPWRWTPMIKFNVAIFLKSNVLIYQNDLKSLIEVGLHLQLLLRRLFGLSEYHFFTSAVFEVSSASAKHPSCCVWVFESLIQTYINWTCWNTFTYYFILKFEFREAERARTGNVGVVYRPRQSLWHGSERGAFRCAAAVRPPGPLC